MFRTKHSRTASALKEGAYIIFMQGLAVRSCMIFIIYFLTSLNKKSPGVAAVAVEGDETVLF